MTNQKLTRRQFDSLANELFGEVLAPHGFTSSKSKHCTFYRKITDKIYHFIRPDQFTKMPRYDISVFPASPVCAGLSWDSNFPDEIGIITMSQSYLHEQRGVGYTQDTFSCKHEQVMRSGFDRRVKPALFNHAIPYLDSIQSIEDMIPLIRHRLSLGLALHHVGCVDEARPILIEEYDKFNRSGSDDPKIAAILRYLDELLGS